MRDDVLIAFYTDQYSRSSSTETNAVVMVADIDAGSTPHLLLLGGFKHQALHQLPKLLTQQLFAYAAFSASAALFACFSEWRQQP